MTMMGCKFSKIGSEGAMFRRTRLRPLLLQQIAAMRTWRLPARPAKDTPSKKGLLLEEKPLQNSVAIATVITNTYGLKVSTNSKIHDAQPKLLAQAEDDDDHDQGRMIGACPASPSFRIFFEDAAHQQQIGKNEALRETNSPRDDAALSKQEKSVQKKVKRKMKRHIKSVMLKRREAMKKLLNVEACACYNPSHRPHTIPDAQTTTFN